MPPRGDGIRCHFLAAWQSALGGENRRGDRQADGTRQSMSSRRSVRRRHNPSLKSKPYLLAVGDGTQPFAESTGPGHEQEEMGGGAFSVGAAGAAPWQCPRLPLGHVDPHVGAAATPRPGGDRVCWAGPLSRDESAEEQERTSPGGSGPSFHVFNTLCLGAASGDWSEGTASSRIFS